MSRRAFLCEWKLTCIVLSLSLVGCPRASDVSRWDPPEDPSVNVVVEPASDSSPEERASRIYQALERGGILDETQIRSTGGSELFEGAPDRVREALIAVSGSRAHNEDLMALLADELRALGHRSEVSFKTARPGAFVKYRFISEEHATTFPDDTDTTPRLMPFGIYYIWTERQGVVTSPRDAQYDITETREEITLDEDPDLVSAALGDGH